jgi:hypothetical protein
MDRDQPCNKSTHRAPRGLAAVHRIRLGPKFEPPHALRARHGEVSRVSDSSLSLREADNFTP